jgi:ubiquinone/menaquinone biosynthesis C-methylase UbiE
LRVTSTQFAGLQTSKKKGRNIVDSADTFERSCDHWSEASRSEMEDFYVLASIDYRHLAEAIDWKAWLEIKQTQVGLRCLRLLDVACGSGKFPTALASYSNIENASIKPVSYSLLDPSKFSISEARQVLTTPFKAGTEYEMKLQDLKCQFGYFDIVWAIHALYAIPQNELESALQCIIRAMGHGAKKNNNGAGFIAHASKEAHYLKFFQHYLKGFKGGVGEPYTNSEQIISVLTQMGVSIEIKEINYINEAPQSQESQVEKYLQRCLFDDTLSLQEMMANPITGPYLETCQRDDMWQFSQSVTMIFMNVSSNSTTS